ncbi:LuxR family transcriptional regulator [Tsukamurella spumae]|uniref:LuxR family transcriptional regulator n=2 Tax=Tsukamurella spumae TaxID=44753 RepID=A0A846WZM9_9ACTN|nr:LuxR family transcriptional regulator [Tsukamurella spumae]
MVVMETVENSDRLIDRPTAQRTPPMRPPLSAREVEVLLAWFASDSKEGAASRLFISPATVATHIARVRAKYTAAHRDARSKTALFARMLEDGYTDLRDW